MIYFRELPSEERISYYGERAQVHRQFGRDYVPDGRDRRFRMANVRSGDKDGRTSKFWQDHRWFGDQGSTPHCVGYSWAHWLNSAPYRQYLDPNGIYALAQLFDEWEGTDYDGTSVRGAAKALSRLGVLGAYHWAQRVEEVADALLYQGPVVVGTMWYEGMNDPGPSGKISVEGDALGGHAYLLTGVCTAREIFRVKNSYGRSWGKGGRGYLPFEDFEVLLRQDGEACLGIENNLEAK